MSINEQAFNYIKEKFPSQKHIDDYINELRQLIAAASGSTRNWCF
jgi:hypothetical protein